jgi:putative DNA primase/helicase
MLEQQYVNGKRGKFEGLPTLQLSDDALTHWVNYHNDVEAEMKAGGDMEEARDIASKSADNAARLAGLFHLFSGADVLDAISSETMQAACRLAGWHLYEARRFFGEVALPKDDLDTVKLDRWLIAECKATGSNAVGKTSTLQRVTPASLRKVDKLNKALDTLERANRIRQTKEGKTAVIEVNPALLEGVK